MATTSTPAASDGSTQPDDQDAGLPRLTLEARARLGPDATPEQVAAEVRALGYPGVTVEDVRQLWDEGHLPAP